MRARRSLPYVLAATAATLCWGAGTTLTKLALAWFEPSFLLVVQLLASLLCLGVALPLSGAARPRRVLSRYSLLGLLEPGLAYFLGLAGLRHIGASEAVLLCSMESILVILLAWALAFERPRPMVLLLAAVGTTGAILVTAGNSGIDASVTSLWGDLLVLAGVLCAAGYVVWSSRLAAATDPLPALIGQQGVAMLFALVMHLCVSTQRWSVPSAPAEGWALAMVSGVVQYAAAFWLYLWALKGLCAAEAGMYLSLIPVFGLFTAIPVLRERLTTIQWSGALLIIGAVIVLMRLRGDAQEEPPQPLPAGSVVPDGC